jgi:molybdopterin synthase catalytic subunit
MKELDIETRIHLNINHKQLNINDSINFVTNNSSGAIAIFLGNTRDSNLGRSVKFLEYEAYEPMADKKLLQIAQEMLQKWGINKVSIQHRTGKVALGETSLVVAVSSEHRKEAFSACEYSIIRIKEIVPIWKKEYYEDGEIWIGAQSGIVFEPKTKVDFR